MLVDVGAYPVERLPAGNLVSLVMAAEGMMGPGEASDVREEALGLLSSGEREQFRETFLSWFRLLLGRAGVDLEVLEDRAMTERTAQGGELRTTWRNASKRYTMRIGPRTWSNGWNGSGNC